MPATGCRSGDVDTVPPSDERETSCVPCTHGQPHHRRVTPELSQRFGDGDPDAGRTGTSPPLSLDPTDDAVGWVHTHLGHLTCDGPGRAGGIRGGERSARAALASFDVAGYAARRNEVLPVSRRGASGLSPYIRHGLLTLPEMWTTVADGPTRDRRKFRDELLWQEYARHLYARVGRALGDDLRYTAAPTANAPDDPWAGDLACVRFAVDELETDGWLVNQTRMWLASHWSVRHGADWRAGEDRFFRHLLDGSRAANRAGWQWTTGRVNGSAYGFSRRQVERRAPGLCDSCAHRHRCPIEQWPDDPRLDRAGADTADTDLSGAPDAGPDEPELDASVPPATAVWLTAESLGDSDPALVAHPDLPAVFVFDEPLLARLRLATKRLVFLTECLADLAERRSVEVHLGDPVEVLAGRALATTHSPVPGGARRRGALTIAALHPWPWLRRPTNGPIGSFSAWRRGLESE